MVTENKAKLSGSIKPVCESIADFATSAFCILTALALVTGHNPTHHFSLGQFLLLSIVSFFHVGILFTRGVYSLNPRYFALYDLSVFVASALLPASMFGYLQYRFQITGHPQQGVASLFVLYVCISTTLLSLLRIAYGHISKKECRSSQRLESKRVRTLIVGAGDAGELISREILVKQTAFAEVVGFVDDDVRKRSLRIHGVKVLGSLDQIPEIVDRYRVDEILLTIPVASGEVMRRMLSLCSKTTARVKTLPGLDRLVGAGAFLMPQLREIQLEDLLRREQIPVDHGAISGYVRGQRVLITGGGGSIGSELARQLAKMDVESLILLGRGENSIYEIEQELLQTSSLVPYTVIADVRDRIAMAKVFIDYKPTVVFHAAAHKHVPLMQKNVAEAVKNNILGTLNVAELSDIHGVEHFVLISTDKAVNPSSVMGATKRVCEMIVANLNRQSKTGFSVVRFGNVLGSRGSLVPLLNAQIKRGGPVTVTHHEMTRYFMTIPEAVQLVLQAGALGGNGEIFILDMGDPVRIEDLALDLIRLHGFLPGDDIAVRFTGIRPGEKMHEELAYKAEDLKPTRHPKIRVIPNTGFGDHTAMRTEIGQLIVTCDQLDPELSTALLMNFARRPQLPSVETRAQAD